MNNFNHPNDKLKASHCDTSNNSQCSDRMHDLKKLLWFLESAYEGFYLSKNYSNADIDETLRREGQALNKFYKETFEETLLKLNCFLDGMKNNNHTSSGEK